MWNKLKHEAEEAVLCAQSEGYAQSKDTDGVKVFVNKPYKVCLKH